MIDFQKIRNKQKWLFGIIAIPVIIGFVIMFTPDATDTLLGRNNPRGQQADFGEINGKPVTRDQWLTARQLSLMMYSRYGNEFMERKIVDFLVLCPLVYAQITKNRYAPLAQLDRATAF